VDIWQESDLLDPLPIITPDCFDAPLVCLSFNNEWRKVVLAALSFLKDRGAWEGEDNSEIDRMLSNIETLESLIVECEDVPTEIYTVGEIIMLAHDEQPEGFVLCDGTEYAITDYQRLFAVIGDVFGGNGTTTFAVPRLNRKVPIGWNIEGMGADLLIGDQIGEEEHTLTIAEMPSHTHQLFLGSSETDGSRPARGTTISAVEAPVVATGGDDPHNNMQPALALAFYIYVGIPTNPPD
jgi:microcystin-dependent protein